MLTPQQESVPPEIIESAGGDGDFLVLFVFGEPQAEESRLQILKQFELIGYSIQSRPELIVFQVAEVIDVLFAIEYFDNPGQVG